MNYITVLDFEAGRVFQYKLETEMTYDGYEYEDFITDKGHNLANCEWMLHENPKIIAAFNYDSIQNKYEH